MVEQSHSQTMSSIPLIVVPPPPPASTIPSSSNATADKPPAIQPTPANPTIDITSTGVKTIPGKTIQESSIAAILNKLTGLKVLDKYKNVYDVKTTGKASNEWSDSELISKKKLVLNFMVTGTDEEKANSRKLMCSNVAQCLSTSVSHLSVGFTLLCAFHLISVEDPSKNVFSANHIYDEAIDTPVTSLHPEELARTDAPEYEVDGSIKELKGFAYLAASMMRMITKSSTNYMNAFDHIVRSYQNFYREPFPISIRPHDTAIRMFKQLIQSKAVFRNSAAIFLYEMEDLAPGDKGMCKLLFEQHLAFTGIHSLPLFIDAASRLKLTSGLLLNLLEHPWNEDALNTISYILQNYVDPARATRNKELSQRNSRETWKYARIFDETIFATLQTKACPFLTGVLAAVNQRIGTKGAGNIMNIPHIMSMYNVDPEQFDKPAKKIYDFARMLRGANINEQQQFLSRLNNHQIKKR